MTNNDLTPVAASDNAVDAAKKDTTAEPTRVVRPRECAFAWVSIILGYLFCRLLPISEHPLGALFFTLALYICAAIFMILSGARQTSRSLFYLVAPLAALPALVLSSSKMMHTLCFLWAMLCFVLWVTLSYGGGLEKRTRELLFFDAVKAVLVLPLASFGALGRSLFPKYKKSGARQVLFACLGLLIAIIPTIVVVMLLGYDQSFSSTLDTLASFISKDMLTRFTCLIFGIPVAAYGFGALISASEGKHERVMRPDACRKFAADIRFAPVMMVCFATIPLLAVYAIFFFSQWSYYVSAFTGKLPAGVDIYSQYAREGFENLCVVAGINAAAMTAISAFTKRRREDRSDAATRVFGALLSVSTLILIATAMAKMLLYIKAYGLTHLRVYASWFMLLLAAGFTVMLLKQLFPRVNAAASLTVIFALMLTALAVSDPDRMIARYNVDRYIDGTLADADVRMLESDCGDSAIPELVRLYEYIAERDGDSAAAIKNREYIRSHLARWKEEDDAHGGILSMTLPKYRARRAVADLSDLDTHKSATDRQ